MNVISKLEDWQAFRSGLPAASLGFVPTMGALHAGHMSLVERSGAENITTVVSIFVNPTQFDQPSDLAAYPRTPERDLDLLSGSRVDAVFMPDFGTLYPAGQMYHVSESRLSLDFCGVHRPGHFDGVLTVVMKLLNLVRPDRAYFGEKDFQQLELIRGLVEAFFMPVEIRSCPIVREADGLAMSSRNRNLDAEQRRRAGGLFRALSSGHDAEQVSRALEECGFTVDYVKDFKGRRLAAARLGSTRLIDNVSLD